MAYVGTVAIKRDIRATLEYDINPEKTRKELAALRDTSLSAEERIKVVFEYSTRPAKTESEDTTFVTGIHVNVDTAIEEVMQVKRMYNKLGGVEAHHFWQSFPLEDNLTPQMCHEIGLETAKRVFEDRFQVVVSTHLDGTYLHNHFFVNSVSFADGKKYYGNKKSLRRFREISDEICVEHDLSVIEQGKARYLANDKGLLHLDPARSWRQALMFDMDASISSARSLDEFYKEMAARGYVFKRGKHFAVGPPGMTRQGRQAYIRLDSLNNDDYSLAGVERRISENAALRLRPDNTRIRVIYARKNVKGRKFLRKLPYFSGAYAKARYRYGYMRKKPRYISYAKMRQGQALAASLSRQIRYLHTAGIKDPEALAARKANVTQEIRSIERERKAIYNAKMRGGEASGEALTAINAALGPLKAERRIIAEIEKGAYIVPKLQTHSKGGGEKISRDERQQKQEKKGETRI